MADKKEAETTDSTAAPAQAAQRIRLSVWIASHNTNATSLTAATGIVDDVTLLKTYTIDASFNIKFDGNATIAPDKRKFYRDIIRAGHTAKLQVIAGWDMANSGAGKNLNTWLKTTAKGSPTEVTRVATQLVTELNKDLRDTGDPNPVLFDGISFDIEDIPNASVAADLVAFYQEVATQLAAAPAPNSNKLVGVANGGMVTDRDSTTAGGGALPSAIAQPYNMVNGQTNMILRPMCYDNFSIAHDPSDPSKGVQPPPSTLTRWHTDVMDYAQTTPSGTNAPDVKLGQFQLGIKNFIGSSNHPRKVHEDPPGSNVFVDANGTKIKNNSSIKGGFSIENCFDACMTDPVEIRKRCLELRQRGFGLVIFAFPAALDGGMPSAAQIKSFWDNVASYNYALNSTTMPAATFAASPSSDPDFHPASPADNTTKPSVISVPRQVPHTKDSIDRLKV
jgi:hypothetical protein